MTIQETEAKTTSSESMEDILTTIRNVIASDTPPARTPTKEEEEDDLDILELTEVVEEGNPEMMIAPPAPAAATTPADPAAKEPAATASDAREDMLTNIDKALDRESTPAPSATPASAPETAPVAASVNAPIPAPIPAPAQPVIVPPVTAAPPATTAPPTTAPPTTVPVEAPQASQAPVASPNLLDMVDAATTFNAAGNPAPAMSPTPTVTPSQPPFEAPSAFSAAATPNPAFLDAKTNLLSEDVMKSSAELLKSFADTVSAHQAGLRFRSGMTLEEIVIEALKPQLAEWLEKHLPNIVQRIVEREIQKLIPDED